MTERRFTDKPDLDPTAVRGLPESHPAMVGNRTLFPSTVVTVTADTPDRILVSGVNNRKLGKTVAKGKFAGYALYQLSLEERATCPADCSLRSECYGSSMQFARRHRIGDPDVFFDRIETEIGDLLKVETGLLIRLHVLGDFPSVEYVAFWADMLNQFETLAVFGYTHRQTAAWGGDEIGDAIQAVKDSHPDRFRIRWSRTVSAPDSAVVINYVPEKPRIDAGIVCPAQTDATACCASCGLCWSAPHDTIVFIKHGPKSGDAAAGHEMAKSAPPRQNPSETVEIRQISPLPAAVVQNVQSGATRPIAAIDLPKNLKPNRVLAARPEVRIVDPTTLRVEPRYQRDLSGKSIKLIRKIVENWDWAKFKPPVCAETIEGLFVIDGQHTAIAAASHVDIKEIPVLVVSADRVEKRAEAFVSHNRDRLAMSPLQVFHAEVAAGKHEAFTILKTASAAGCDIPRFIPPKGEGKPGLATAITAFQRILKTDGEATLLRIFKIARLAGVAPIASTLAYGLQILLKGQPFAAAAALPDDEIAAAIRSIPDLEAAAQAHGSEAGQNRYRSCAVLIFEAAIQPREVAA